MHKKVDDQENDLHKIAAFEKFWKVNIVIFSVIENFCSKNNSTNIRYKNNL